MSSKLKSIMNFFVTVEDAEGDEIPEEAGSEDADVAAQAARQRAEAGPVGQPADGKRVADYVEDPYAGSLDEEMLASNTPDIEGEATFDPIYAAAGLPVEADAAFTVFKVERLLNSEHLAGLGDRAKAASVLVALEANSIKLNTVIQDAVARDKALDNYDQMLRHDVKSLEASVEENNAAIEKQVEEFLQRKREEVAQNNRGLAEAKELYARWRMKKQAEEERLFAAVTPFVDANPITRGQD